MSALEALQHPNWKMGRKITIDSATMMNKGLEVIEAHHLFHVPVEQVQVVVHPKVSSILWSNSMTVCAGATGDPDMRIPISYALAYPERLPNTLPSLDLFEVQTLHFYPPDPERFPCLRLAFEAARRGGTMPAVLNAANEIAVQAFLDGVIPFWTFQPSLKRRWHSIPLYLLRMPPWPYRQIIGHANTPKRPSRSLPYQKPAHKIYRHRRI